MLSFELHLLESGISGYIQGGKTVMVLTFELHLLESGISGHYEFSLFKDFYQFELHLLESGISGLTLSRSLREGRLV